MQPNIMRKKYPVRWLTITAMFMAINIVLSSFGIPVPGGHLYLNDIIICTASILLDPLGAFIVGGIGAFLGDLLFYPAPMFVSLVTHGLQAVLIALCVGKLPLKSKARRALTGVAVGAIVMVAGYSFGRAYIYSTPEYALIKLPYQILQAAVGAVGGMLICFSAGIDRLFEKLYK